MDILIPGPREHGNGRGKPIFEVVIATDLRVPSCCRRVELRGVDRQPGKRAFEILTGSGNKGSLVQRA